MMQKPYIIINIIGELLEYYSTDVLSFLQVSRYHSYLNSAKEILSVYNGSEPLASFLKKYFSQYKKHGSNDRKQIAQLCYCYFRSGKALTDIPVEEKFLSVSFFVPILMRS